MILTDMQKKVTEYNGGRLFVNASRRAGKTTAIVKLIEKWVSEGCPCYDVEAMFLENK